MPVKNICQCDNPPGGDVLCEPDQLAICIVNNGVAKRECMDAPDDLGDLVNLTRQQTIRYLNWALSHITGQIRLLSSPISSQDRAILSQGRYDNAVTGDVVTFSLPEALNLHSPGTASSSGSSSSGGASDDSDYDQLSSGGATAT
jgi:hypothetical protein